MGKRLALATCIVASFIAVGIGCSSSDDSNNGTAQTAGSQKYKGVFAGAKESGTLDVSIENAPVAAQTLHVLATQPITAAIALAGGGSVSASGTYDSATSTISITGGGYTFTGSAVTNGFQ